MGKPVSKEMLAIDDVVCNILKNRYMTKAELKKFYKTYNILDVALVRIGNKYPLMEEPKEKGKKIKYKILTFKDIDDYLESRKSFVY